MALEPEECFVFWSSRNAFLSGKGELIVLFWKKWNELVQGVVENSADEDSSSS